LIFGIFLKYVKNIQAWIFGDETAMGIDYIIFYVLGNVLWVRKREGFLEELGLLW